MRTVELIAICYYVQAIPQYGDNTVYMIPGQIRVEVDEYDDGEKLHYSREYFIEKVFFDDGTYLDFTNDGGDTTLTGSVTLKGPVGRRMEMYHYQRARIFFWV